MDKRYQVFISSTYADLKDERQAVIKTVIEADCIPAGMELFPATDEEQLAFIKRVIDDCDYYLIILAGRYGSISQSGLSYTEQEYDYAVSKGLKVIALVHANPDGIVLGKSEKDPASQEKLKKFREKVCTGRVVKQWSNSADLPALVALSLVHTIRLFPAVGWVRANKAASEDVLGEINELRKQNEELGKQVIQSAKEVAALTSTPVFKDLAGLDERIGVRGEYWNNHFGQAVEWTHSTTWRKIFGYISPYLIKHPSADTVKQVLASALFKEEDIPGSNEGLDDQDFQTIGVQLQAVGLVKIEYLATTSGNMGLFWAFTPKGKHLMLELRTVRTKRSVAEDKG